MHGLQPLLAFVETAKHGGFAAAARELGTAPSTLAKAVARLEASLALRLFHRTTRQVTLTADGERLFQRCQRVLSELDELQSEAAGARAAPSGTLRINIPLTYGRRVLLPLLARVVQQYPALSLDVRLSDAFVDLVRDGIDVAIRVGALDDSTLVGRQFDSQTQLLIASPAYLKKQGTPSTPRDLATHRAIIFRLPGRGRDLPRRFNVDGRVIDVAAPVQAYRFDDGDAMVRAAVLDLGLAQVPDYMAADELAAGRVVEVMREWRPAAQPIHAVMPGQRLMPARVRVFVDALVAMKDEAAHKGADARSAVSAPINAGANAGGRSGAVTGSRVGNVDRKSKRTVAQRGGAGSGS